MQKIYTQITNTDRSIQIKKRKIVKQIATKANPSQFDDRIDTLIIREFVKNLCWTVNLHLEFRILILLIFKFCRFCQILFISLQAVSYVNFTLSFPVLFGQPRKCQTFSISQTFSDRLKTAFFFLTFCDFLWLSDTNFHFHLCPTFTEFTDFAGLCFWVDFDFHFMTHSDIVKGQSRYDFLATFHRVPRCTDIFGLFFLPVSVEFLGSFLCFPNVSPIFSLFI